MSYKRYDELEVLLFLIVGDGDSSRTFRNLFLTSSLKHVGIFSGPHDNEGHQSCLVFADTYFDNVDDSTVTQTAAEYLSLDDAIFEVINNVRTDPTDMIAELQTRVTYFQDGDFYKAPGKVKESTVEGAAAY